MTNFKEWEKYPRVIIGMEDEGEEEVLMSCGHGFPRLVFCYGGLYAFDVALVLLQEPLRQCLRVANGQKEWVVLVGTLMYSAV